MRKRTTGINVGGSSILVIFVLSSLTTFATLSLVSANTDFKLTQKTASASQAYYAADAQAEEILAKVDDVLQSAVQGSVDQYQNQVASGMASILDTAVVYMPTGPDSGTVSYGVPLGETQELEVVLNVQYQKTGQRYRISQWKVVSTAPLELLDGNDKTKLWDGKVSD